MRHLRVLFLSGSGSSSHMAVSSVYGVDFAVEVLKHAALSFPQKED